MQMRTVEDVLPSLEILATSVCDTARRLLHDGLAVGTAGNVSVRDPRSGLIAVTPAAFPYDLLQPADVSIVDARGSQLRGTRPPTSELALHLMIYERRPETGAVVHTHSPFATVFSVLRRPIPCVCNEGLAVGAPSVDVTEWAVPGSAELAEAAATLLKRHPGVRAFLLANHGAVAMGADLRAAFDLAAQVEWEAAVYHRALQVGAPRRLSVQQYEAAVRRYAPGSLRQGAVKPGPPDR